MAQRLRNLFDITKKLRLIGLRSSNDNLTIQKHIGDIWRRFNITL